MAKEKKDTPKRSKKAPANKQLYKFTMVCKEDGEIVHADGVGATFKCPTCGLRMRWNKVTRELLAHGKEKRTIKHEIRVAQEI